MPLRGEGSPVNNFTGTTGINWDSPKQTGIMAPQHTRELSDLPVPQRPQAPGKAVAFLVFPRKSFVSSKPVLPKILILTKIKVAIFIEHLSFDKHFLWTIPRGNSV